MNQYSYTPDESTIYQKFSNQFTSGSTHKKGPRYFDFLRFRKHDVDSTLLDMLIQIGEFYNLILLILLIQ